MQLFRTWRGSSGEFVQWVARFEVASKCVLNAWMDHLDLSDFPSIDGAEFENRITQEEYVELENIADYQDRRDRAAEIRDDAMNREKSRHKDKFPLSDNLMSLIFLVQADLNEQQRERFVASMSLRQVDMIRYS